MKSRLLIFSVLVLASCGTANRVTTLIPDDAVVKYKQQQGMADRFSNLYPKKANYPVTCEHDCYPSHSALTCQQPMENCIFEQVQNVAINNTGFNVKWLGHASFVINTADGHQLLFDPVFAQFDWPVNWAFRLSAGFNRNLPSEISQQTLTNTDAVLYSHIHYDHFNKSDIESIGSQAQYLTPLGFAEHFSSNGYDVTEMAWYTSKNIADLNIHFVPAHHFSSRVQVPYIYEDDDKTLWGGWVIEHKGKKLFFAGDTGYSKHFKDIRQRYGEMDVCLIPIASYHHKEHSQWYRYVHTTPEDALIAADELNCKVMIPWGYGNASWKMGDHTSHSALFRLLHMKKKLATKTPLYILNEGGSVAF